MPRFAVVSRERHGRKRWLRFNGYGFAATDVSSPSSAPSWRGRHSRCHCAVFEQAGRYTLVAVLSLVPGRNMFVGPGGTLVGLLTFRPGFASTRFACCRSKERTSWCCASMRGAGLSSSACAAGEEFFDGEGNPSPALKPVFEALTVTERSRKGTDLAVAALAQAGVIRPWQISSRQIKANRRSADYTASTSRTPCAAR